MSGPALAATVIIPCRKIDALTRRCVDVCLRVLTNAEILVVPDAIPPAQDMLEQVRILPSGPVPPATKRNLAVNAATTEFVAFIDSDAFPESGWTENAIAILKQDPTIIAVGGPILSPPDEPLGERIVGNASRTVILIGPVLFRKTISPARDCGHMSSCNLVLSRRDYLAVGGMDELHYTNDDSSLSLRLRSTGRRIRYSPDVIVYHKNRRLRGLFLQRVVMGMGSVDTLPSFQFLDTYYYLAFAAFIIFLLVGPLFLLSPVCGPIWLAVVGIYLGSCLFESVRTSSRLREFPGTLLAAITGSLAAGLGVLVKLLHIPVDPNRIYRNTD